MRSTYTTLAQLSSLLLGLPQAIAAPAFSSSPSPVSDTGATLGETVVTATRFPEKRATVPAHISVITSEQIRQSMATNVPDLLRDQVGIHVMDITGSERSYAIDMGGFGEMAHANTLVLVDGRRVNQADLSGTDWLQIPLERVAKIEWVRGGGAAVLYGDNASGGVINIITHDGDDNKGHASLQAGQHGAVKGHIGWRGLQDKLSYTLNTGYRRKDGYRDNSETNAHDVGVTLAYDWSESLTLNLRAGYQEDDAGYPSAIKESDFAAGFPRTGTLTPQDGATTKDVFLQIGPTWRSAQGHLVQWDWAFRRRQTDSQFHFSGGHFASQTDIQTWSMAPRVQLNHARGDLSHTWTLGMDYQHDENEIHNDSLFFGDHTIGHFVLTKKTRGYYLHNALHVSDDWQMTAGYRLDVVDFSFSPSANDRDTLDEEAFSVGLRHDWDQATHAYLNYAKSFRYPFLDEQYSFWFNTVNTDLQPQRTEEFQLGMQHRCRHGLEGDLHLFRSTTEREIFYDVRHFNNVNLDGRARRLGVKLTLEKQWDDWLWKGNYAWTETTIEGGLYNGKELPGVPKHQAAMTLRYAPTEQWAWRVDGRWIGTRRWMSDLTNRLGTQPSHVVFDTGLQYHWPHWTGSLTVTNVTGKQYAEYGVMGYNDVTADQERAYFPSPERQLMVGLSVRF